MSRPDLRGSSNFLSSWQVTEAARKWIRPFISVCSYSWGCITSKLPCISKVWCWYTWKTFAPYWSWSRVL